MWHIEPVTEQWQVLSTPRERAFHHANALRNGIYVAHDSGPACIAPPEGSPLPSIVLPPAEQG